MPARCGHQLSSNKRMERIDNLVAFTKTATDSQLASRLADTWVNPHSTIGEARMLLTLGASPLALYEGDYGKKMIDERRSAGTLCGACAEGFEDFLVHAGVIYEEMCEQPSLDIDRSRRVPDGVFPMCLDGGGVRGLVSVVCLLFTSRRLLGDLSLPTYFNWLVGTSTGSMLALAIAKGLTLKETFFMYWEMKRQIFLEGSTMSRLLGNQVDAQTKNINEALQRIYPEDTLKQCNRRITVPALDISTSPASMHIFRNYSLRKPFPADDDVEDASFRDVARASSAAPTYFHAHEMKGRLFVDGSLVANCPLNVLFKEYDTLMKNNNPIRLLGVLSVGTGEPKKTDRKYKTGKNLTRKAKNIAHLSTLILEQVVGHDQSVVEIARDRCEAHGIPFFRISPSDINVRIDQVDDTKLLDMIWKCLLHLTANVQTLDALGEVLVKLLSDSDRKRRSNTTL